MLRAIARVPWIRSSPAPRATLVFWLGVATTSLAAALWLIHTNGGSEDYYLLRDWLATWRSGFDPYRSAADPSVAVDYPPYAFLILAPLSWLPALTGREIFAGVNVLLGVLAAWQLVRCVAELSGATLTRTEVTASAAVLLSVRAVRAALIAGQTMFLSVLLFVIALRLARRRRTWLAGLCLAIASYKVNLAFGFGLAMLALGDGASVLAGAAWIALFMLLASWSFHLGPVRLISEWLHNLVWMYTGPTSLRMATGIRTLLTTLSPNYALAEMGYTAFVVISGAFLVGGVRRARAVRAAPAVVAFAVLLWSMLILPNQVYNTVLVVGVLWLVVWPEGQLLRAEWARWTAGGVTLLYLLPSVPFSMQQRTAWMWDAADGVVHGALSAVWPHRARLCVFVFFVLLVTALYRRARPLAAVSAGADGLAAPMRRAHPPTASVPGSSSTPRDGG